jgi:competence protein ComEC
MNKVLALIEHTPYAGISKIWLSTPVYLLLYVVIISAFYFLYEKKLWLLKMSVYGMLIAAVLISFKRWDNMRSDNIAFLNLKRHTGIVFKHGEQAVVISDLTDSDKIYKYSVQPYLDSCQVSSIHTIAPTANIQLPFLLKKTHLVQFGNKMLLIFDRQLQQIALNEKLKLDYLYIADNPSVDINFLNKYYDYKLLIIGNNNANSLIASLQTQASYLHINYRVLPRNKSVILVSN